MKFVSQISSILVALLFVCSINFKSIITIDYILNSTEITELFCVNKEKPELQCNGKCHLAKQLVKAEKEENEMPFSNQSLAYQLDLTSILTHTLVNFIQPALENTIHATFYGLTTIDHWYRIPSPPPKG